MAPPPRTIAVAGLAARSTKPSTRARCVGVDERRDGGRVVSRIAEHVLVGTAWNVLEEDVADRFLDEEARAGEADLARVVVLAGRLARGRVEVGVLEHDEAGSCRRARR